MTKDYNALYDHLKAAVCSGSYVRAYKAVRKLVSLKNRGLWLRMIGDAYIDHQGKMWVNSQMVQENPDRQQVVDYAFWQIFALAPESVCAQADIRRHQVTIIYFRRYSLPPQSDSARNSLLRRLQSRRSGYTTGKMRRMPPDVWRFTRLREINANDTAFAELPASIGKCRLLTCLQIRSLKSRTLPEAIGELQKLETLRITGGSLSRLPVQFGSLRRLMELNLSNNRFKAIPVCLAGCIRLSELDMSQNSLTRVSATIAHLRKLWFLDLSQNRDLKEIHPALARLTNLNVINTEDCDAFPLCGHFTGSVELFFRKLNLALNPDAIAPDQESEEAPISDSGEMPGNTNQAINLILSMLLSYKEENHQAAFRLLQSSADPELTEQCLSALPEVSRRVIESDNDWGFPYSFQEKLLTFLTAPDCQAVAKRGFWRTRVHNFILHGDWYGILYPVQLFPKLRALGVAFDEFGSWTGTKGLEPLEVLAIRKFNGMEIRIDKRMRSCWLLRLIHSKVREEFSIDGLQALEEVRLEGSIAGALLIRNCRKLTSLQVSFPETNNWDSKDFLQEKLPYPSRVVISDCPNLSHINLRNCRISELDITGCPKLEFLTIQGKGEEILTIQVDRLPRLKALTIKACRLQEVPGFILKCSLLDKLNLEENELADLPDGLYRLKNLRYLFISGNRFSEFPACITRIGSLAELDLGWQTTNSIAATTIQMLPESLRGLKRLKMLYVLLSDIKLRKSAGILRRSRTVVVNPNDV